MPCVPHTTVALQLSLHTSAKRPFFLRCAVMRLLQVHDKIIKLVEEQMDEGGRVTHVTMDGAANNLRAMRLMRVSL